MITIGDATEPMDPEILEWISSVHLEYIENREREAIEHDEAVVKSFLEARLNGEA